MMIHLTVDLHPRCAPRRRVTPRMRELAAMFGLDAQRPPVAESRPVSLTLGAGRILFATGASGGGKSTLLRAVRCSLADRDEVRVINFDDTRPTSRCGAAIIDALGDTLCDATRFLSRAGLSDARLMLQSPRQLSEGEQFRLRLAVCMAAAARGLRGAAPGLTVLLVDEFASSLDRLTAAIIARNVRKWISRTGLCLLAATAHDDLLEHLEPDTLIAFDTLGRAEVMERGAGK